MIRTVLKYVAIAMVVLLIALWMWAGGFAQVTRFVKTIANPIDIIWGTSTSTYEVALPWQLPVPQGPDIELLAAEGARFENPDPEYALQEIQSEYEALNTELTRLKDSVGRSQHYGKVKLSRASALQSSPSEEYLVLDVSGSQSVKISGWSLQSSLRGTVAIIPLGTPVFELGTLNSARTIVLEPGMSAIVVTGFSPLGVSFRENRCTGYLAQLQTFEPPLANACPSPADSMPLTETNLQRYGGDCVDHVRTVPQCTFPSSAPASLSLACHSFIVNTFSYNGCLGTHRNGASFLLDTWRIYLGYPSELWSNNHDVIRLLDEYGQVVDSITY